MKKLTLNFKRLLSLIYIISLLYGFITFVFNLIDHSDTIHYTLIALVLLANISLIFRIYNFKSIEKETKMLWYFVLIFFGFLGIYYIWKVDSKFFDKEIDSINSLHSR